MPSNYSENHNQTFGSNGDEVTSEAAALLPNTSNAIRSSEKGGNYQGFNISLDQDINTIGIPNVSDICNQLTVQSNLALSEFT
jgi:hypothetical protein